MKMFFLSTGEYMSVKIMATFSAFCVQVAVLLFLSGCTSVMIDGENAYKPLRFKGLYAMPIDVMVCDLYGNAISDATLYYNFDPLLVDIYESFPSRVRTLHSNSEGKIKGFLYYDKFVWDKDVFFSQDAVIVAEDFLPVMYYGQRKVFLQPRKMLQGKKTMKRNDIHFLFDEESNRILPLYSIDIPIHKNKPTSDEHLNRERIVKHIFGKELALWTDDDFTKEYGLAICYAIDDRLLQSAVDAIGDHRGNGRSVDKFMWIDVPKGLDLLNDSRSRVGLKP